MKTFRSRWFLVMAVLLATGLLAVTWVQAADSLAVARQTPNTSFGSRSADYFLKIETRSGAMAGTVMNEVCNPCTPLQAFEYNVSSPRDAASGLATGKRQHSPIVIRKAVDKASPLLFKAMTGNETLPRVTIQVVDILPDGSSSAYFKYELTDVVISSYTTGAGDGGHPTEEISLVFSTIKLIHEPSKTMAEDSWTQTK